MTITAWGACDSGPLDAAAFEAIETNEQGLYVSFWQNVVTGSGSGTPRWDDANKVCFWHNYNGNTGPSAPGTVVERILARALRWNGAYDKVSTGARMQAQYIP